MKRGTNMDASKPVTNQKLLEALNYLRNDIKYESLFFRELENAVFLCPCSIDEINVEAKGKRIVLQENTNMSISSLITEDKKRFLMAFTDWNEVQKLRKQDDKQVLMISYEDYKGIILYSNSFYSGMIINPYGDRIVITSEIIRRRSFIEKDRENTVLIGEPNEYPKAMVEDLLTKFENSPFIRSAYLLWMVKDKMGSYLLVIDTDSFDDELLSTISKICYPYLKDKALDITSFDSEFGRDVTSDKKPFYQAK